MKIDTGRTDQAVVGFGMCMSELSHEALWLLPEDGRAKVLDELFLPEGGAFTVIRTPIGASDFAKDFYSYCETPDDFGMKTFSTDHDDATLIPLIHEVQKRVPSDVLNIWGSPWCPPSWMKTNRNAVCRPDKSVVVMVANKESAPKNLAICVDGATLGVTLPASSVATLRH